MRAAKDRSASGFGLSFAIRRAVLIAVATAAGLASAHLSAHKTITSKYRYNEHVFPILRARCTPCHVEGGPTPMSLMTYKDAVPAQRLRRRRARGRECRHQANGKF